jgi:hypothetical protein
MKTIRIAFSDFWPGFDPHSNWWTNTLKQYYNVELSNDPHFLIYSVFGNAHLSYKQCVKVFYTGENIPPNLELCDYAFSFDYLDHPRHFRLPVYILTGGYYMLGAKTVASNLSDRDFCSFVVSNPGAPTRNHFFHQLRCYKPIASGGRYWNNTGGAVKDKIAFLKSFKFSIAFENEAHRDTRFGYTTEKLLHAMRANTLPIYWGNPWIGREFNCESFINCHDFPNFPAVVEYIKYLDSHKEAYLDKLNQPWLINNEIPQALSAAAVETALRRVFDN